MAKHKTRLKLLAVVHADVKGYSRLMQEFGDRAVKVGYTSDVTVSDC